MKSLIALAGSLLLTACVTDSRVHDPAQPSLSWDASCQPEDLPGMASWLLLTCTMTNRSEQTLSFHAIDRITSEKDAWRQPENEELAVLKKDMKSRQAPKSLPLLLNGGNRAEGFVAQVLVVSGIWLTQSIKDPVTLPEKTENVMAVKPGANVRQVFVLYKDSLESPAFVTLTSKIGNFRKQVNIIPDVRQRPAIRE